MWVLVHVTDSVRPTDRFVTYPSSPAVRGTVAAAEGMAAPMNGADPGRAARIQRAKDISRRRHRKAHSLRAASLLLRRRARPAA